jgi:hypothetical protein
MLQDATPPPQVDPVALHILRPVDNQLKPTGEPMRRLSRHATPQQQHAPEKEKNNESHPGQDVTHLLAATLQLFSGLEYYIISNSIYVQK